ncbi:MAG: hypothetical protein JNM43_07110 [Planctomycetaceae bacterium]|nr:hypothetical protein [Planctomycetaceae bacterium]
MQIDEFSSAKETARPSSDVVSTMEVGIASARRVYWILLGLLLLGYACSGMTRIGPNEVGLLRRFGRLVERDGKTVIFPPGLMFTWPVPIDEVIRVPVRQEHVVRIQIPSSDAGIATEAGAKTVSESASESRSEPAAELAKGTDTSGEADNNGTATAAATSASEAVASTATSEITPVANSVLTGDQSLLSAEVEIRFRIVEPQFWVTSSGQPQEVIRVTLGASTAAVLRQWKIDDALLRHRSVQDSDGENLSDAILVHLRSALEPFRLGVEITAMEIISLQPPEDVAEAFAAVQDARVDQEAWRETAEGEHEEVLLNAERMALVAIADSKGKLDSIPGKIAEELALFEADLKAYQQASHVTRERLRREAWESIVRNVGKLITAPSGTTDGRILIPFLSTEPKR